MHQHSFTKTHTTGRWQPSATAGILFAHEEWINTCECGEQRKIRTHPIGTWRKAHTRNPATFQSQPQPWQNLLRDILQRKVTPEPSDISFTAEYAMKASRLPWNQIEGWMATLLDTGIAEIFEPYPRKDPGKTRIHIRAPEVAALVQIYALNKKEEIIKSINAFYVDWEHPPDPSGTKPKHIARIIDQSKDHWHLTGKPEFTMDGQQKIPMKSLANYLLLLGALREIYNIVLLGKTVTFRDFAVDVSGDSKGLENIKPYLRATLGTLEYYGIIEHSPLLFCWLPLIGEMEGKSIDFSASMDYTVITATTAIHTKLITPTLKHLILIENLTPFEKVARQLAHMRNADTGAIFLSGYPPRHIKEFVLKIISLGVQGYVWCDLDPDGIEIALTVDKWFPTHHCRPIAMNPQYLLTSRTKPLTQTDIQKISHIKNRTNTKLHNLIGHIDTLGKKVEQEAQNITPKDLLDEIKNNETGTDTPLQENNK